MLKLKYYYTFKSISNTDYRVEILEDTELEVVAKEIDHASAPFVVSYQDVESKLETVIGSGAKFAIVGKSTFEYLDLYTANIQQYQVRLLKNGAIVWAGWLDTEYYQEDFSLKENIDIDLTAADFNVLERIQYLQADGKPYEGVVSFFDVLKEVLIKLGLPLTSIYIGSATTIPGVTIGANETILHKDYAISRNYYDEDYKALDCRSVLEGILKPYCLTVKQVNNELFIYDIETTLSDNPTFKRYSATTFAYVDTVIVTCNQGDIATIGLTSSESVYATIGSYNRLTLKYSTFKEPVLGDGEFDENSVSDLDTSLPVTDIRSGKDYSYKIDSYLNADSLTLHNRTQYEHKARFIKPIGEYVQTEKTVKGIQLKHLSYSPQSNAISFKAKLPLLINETSRYAIKVEAKLLTITVDNYLADGNVMTAKERGNQALIPFKLFLTEKDEIEILSSGTPTHKRTYNCYDNLALVESGAADKWVKEQKYGDDMPITYSKMQFCEWGLQSSIANKWVNCQPIIYAYNYTGDRPKPLSSSFIIPLPAGSYGAVNFYITQGVEVFNAFGVGIVANIAVKMVLIDGIKLSLVDSVTGDTIELTDVEYNSYINKQYRNDADTIEVIHGVNSEKFPNENGAILLKNETNNSYYFASTFTRAGATDTIEKLHLRTFISNYKVNTSALTCELNSTIKPLGYVTYNNHLPGKALGIYGFELNYSDEIVKISTKEILKDSIDINTITYEPN